LVVVLLSALDDDVPVVVVVPVVPVVPVVVVVPVVAVVPVVPVVPVEPGEPGSPPHAMATLPLPARHRMLVATATTLRCFLVIEASFWSGAL
jgi:hypothetical protein